MIRTRGFLSGLWVLLWVAAAAAAGGEQWSLEGRVQEHRLKNGVTVLALQRSGVPTVSLQMTFGVGGVDEPAGRTGTAHLLEHMLFQNLYKAFDKYLPVLYREG